MDKEQEIVLVQSFFVKRVQERVLHELFTPKKRDMALQRLDHRYLSMLKNDYLIEIKPPNSWPDDTYDLLKQHGAPDTCYCLSENELISGKTLPTRTRHRLWIRLDHFLYSRRVGVFRSGAIFRSTTSLFVEETKQSVNIVFHPCLVSNNYVTWSYAKIC
ncbi:hypothetical protein [uncultured Exiguobacterium sp.]|uniref:hypothetical protein n=1 Tax=uncultured Exiguobacterium sp. TaxID=202669 RepID=UPI0025E82003|nr:hypothetical protein [uncultured Exiguobacterium sp.]